MINSILYQHMKPNDRKVNCVRFSRGTSEGWAHAQRKMEVCYHLRKNGYHFFTEVEFDTGGRADIVAIGHNYDFIIEVLHSEHLNNLAKKKRKYPIDDVRVTRTSEIFDWEDLMAQETQRRET